MALLYAASLMAALLSFSVTWLSRNLPEEVWLSLAFLCPRWYKAPPHGLYGLLALDVDEKTLLAVQVLYHFRQCYAHCIVACQELLLLTSSSFTTTRALAPG